jgi:hypothetical protein
LLADKQKVTRINCVSARPDLNEFSGVTVTRHLMYCGLLDSLGLLTAAGLAVTGTTGAAEG